jgi:hypothetical protein
MVYELQYELKEDSMLMRSALTARQREGVDFIRHFMAQVGYQATVREMGAHFDFVPFPTPNQVISACRLACPRGRYFLPVRCVVG